ncbi:N-6 DNA methylase [Helicobacter pullorum]|uniref:N-6 DNA methylase n=1 Tax=Helicobacter pullorum TaxID=35818 RepID=UPI0032097F02
MLKEILQIFQYIQKFHKDNFEALKITLEFLLIGRNKNHLKEILAKDKEQIDERIQSHLLSYGLKATRIEAKMNRKKILRALLEIEVSIEEVERFIQAITLHKTILKLYDYATPMEVNRLVALLLDLKNGESVYNPCCGLGSWLFSLKGKNFQYYGEDIHSKLIDIARILAVFMGFKNVHLEVADIFKDSAFGKLEANKAFCYFPIEANLNLLGFRDEALEPFIKSFSEVPFLAYTLKHFHQKAVFIVRSLLLYKACGERLRKYLIKQKLLEAIIEFPRNIFPHQMEDFSLLILSKQENKKVLFINAQNLFVKEGKYNKLIDIEMICDLYFSKQNTEISRLVAYENIHLENFKTSYYIKGQNDKKTLNLAEFVECIYRGQRVEVKKDEVLIDCYNAGIKDFLEYGLSEEFDEFSPKSNQKRIEQLKIKPYDILLSMRGISPKVAIIGEGIGDKNILPNAGILVLRPKNKEIAKSLYVYFLSKEGFLALSKIYQDNQERIGEREITNFLLPQNFLEYQEKFNKLLLEGDQIRKHRQMIRKILGF